MQTFPLLDSSVSGPFGTNISVKGQFDKRIRMFDCIQGILSLLLIRDLPNPVFCPDTSIYGYKRLANVCWCIRDRS